MSHSKRVSVQRNILANYACRGWSALMGLVFIPVYTRLLGVEAMGVIGLFVTLQALCMLLDAGLSTTLNRELARLTLYKESAEQMRNLLRTFEVPFWFASFLGGAAVVCLAPYISHQWVHVQTISPNVVQTSIQMMGLVLFFQLPLSLYGGGLLGLQRQIEYSSLSAIWYTLRFAGAIAALKIFGTNLHTFFLWQIFVAFLATGMSAVILWRSLPTSTVRAKFDASLFGSRWQFAAGIGAISVTLLVLNNVDKVVLSKALSLEAFGYYTLAWTLANAIRLLADPIYITFFPRLSQAWALGDTEILGQLYHKICRLMAIMVIPFGLTLAFFGAESIRTWTHSTAVVQNTSTLISFLAIGNVALALNIVPYSLQLASGWTSLALWSNLIAACLLVPLMTILASSFGSLGGGIAWMILNCLYLLLTVGLMHKRLLPGHFREWFVMDIGRTILAVGLVLSLLRLIAPRTSSPILSLAILAIAFALAQLTALATSPIRSQIYLRVRGILGHKRSFAT